MIKRFTLSLFLLSLATIGFGQSQHDIDSLQKQLQFAKDDTRKIDAQTALCFYYRLGNTDSALFYGRKALKAAENINYLEAQISVRGFMAVTLEQLGDLPEALDMAFKALQIAKENDLEYKITPALNAIGETYIILKDYPKALSYFRRQEALDKKLNIEEGSAYAIYDIGNVYNEMGKLDSAYFYEQEAIKHFARIGRKEPIVYKTLGDIALKLGDKKEALNQYQQSLRIAISNNERRAIGFAYNKIAVFYKTNGQPDSAIYYAGKGLRESEAIGKKVTSMEAANLLAELYEQKDPEQAMKYLKAANAYKELLFGTNNIYTVQALVSQQEEHQKEIEANRMNYQNKLRLYTLLAGLGIVLLIAIILYRNNLQKQKANKLLEDALSNLKTTQTQLIQSEKMASLGELTAGIAHEIQNPLNFVNNFSEVSVELLDELKEEARAGNNDEVIAIAGDLTQNLEKIRHHGKRADAIIKGMLQHSRQTTGAKEPTDINALCDECLRLSYHGLRAKDKSFSADLKTRFDESIGDINIVSQDIGRVLLNIINNAFYATSQKQKADSEFGPLVSVETKKSNNNIEITISDNGNGIPQNIIDKIFQPFFTTKPTGQGTGLGLSLVYDIITKEHKGTITVKSDEGKGSAFIITIPA